MFYRMIKILGDRHQADPYDLSKKKKSTVVYITLIFFLFVCTHADVKHIILVRQYYLISTYVIINIYYTPSKY